MKGNIKRPGAGTSEEGASDRPASGEQILASPSGSHNLVEAAVRAREQAERAMAGLRQSEALLAQELADTKELQQISALLIGEESIDVLYAKLVAAAVRLLHADMGSIQKVDAETGDLRLLAWQGFHPDSAEFWRVVRDNPGTTCGVVAKGGGRIIVPDVEKADFITGTADLEHFRLSGIKAVQSTPLISRRGKIVGVLSTHWREVTIPSENSLRLLEVLARQAADLIERARVEESLRASEEKFRILSEASPALIWYDDAEGNCVYVNQRYVEFSGKSREELEGCGWQLALHPDDGNTYLEEFRRARKEQRPFRARVRVKRNDGRWRWLESHAQPLFGKDGMFLGHVGVSSDITDTVDAESRLRQSQELFFGLIENAPFGVYLVDSDFRLAQVSLASQKVFANVHPLIGRDFAEVLRAIWEEPFAEMAIERFRHTLETGEEYRSEDTIEHRADIDGVEAYDWMLKRITLPDGRFGVVCYFFDLSERRRAEAALRESQERFEAAQQAGNIGVWDWEISSGATYWSETMWRLYGYDEPLPTAEGVWQKALHPDDAPSTLKKISELLSSDGTTYRDEFRIVRPDGSVRRLEGVAKITRDENGRAVRVSGVNLDITDRTRAEQALRRSEERLRLLTESFEDFAIFTTDTEGNIVTWNPGATKIFGYSESEILGQNARILFVPEDQARGEADREILTARVQGRAADERWHLRKDGSRFYASGIMARLDEDGAFIGFAKIARDLTEQKRAQEELRRQHEELESIVAGRTAELAEANEALVHQMEERRVMEEERFALMQKIVTTQEDERRRIARDMHDSLGQQMTALRLKIASLKDDHPGDRRLVESLERIQELGAKVDAEVNFLVWELRPTVLDDLGLVSAIENYVREWSRHYGIPAEFHAGRFRDERLDGIVETNLYRISQEALTNVFKHSGASNTNVVLEARRNEIVLVVEDNGVGFDLEKVRPHRASGRGFGLVGMRERAAIIGGKVELESAPGKGTTVFVSVPRS